MAKPYDDDLRRKFLAALDRGEGTLTELSRRFGVTVAWGWKISAARNRSGHAERVRHRPGRKRLSGTVEVDEAYWGAEESGLIGRLTVNKAIIAVAVEEEIGRASCRERV